MLVDATLECVDFGLGLGVALGSAARTYVGFTTNGGTFYPRLFTIEPPAPVQVASAIVDAVTALVATDPAGDPFLAGGEVPKVGVGFFRRAGAAWALEAVSPPPGPNEFYQARGVRFATDGRAFVAYENGMNAVGLGVRDAAGTWRHVAVGAGQNSALAVDGQQRAHVVYAAQGTGAGMVSVIDWREGAAPRPLLSRTFGISSAFSTSAVGTSGIAASVRVDDGIHVLVTSNDGPTVTDVPVPGSQFPAVTGCQSPFPCMPISGSTTCTETGEGGLGQQVVATDGAGTLWLAHVLWHVDRDVKRTTIIGESVSCTSGISVDRSSSELVLASVPLDGKAAPRIRWRASLVGNPEGLVAMDAKGSRLALAFVTGRQPDKTTIRYVVLDASQL